MIKSLKVTNSYGSSLTMTLNDPYQKGYAITGISGLEPPQVDIKQTQMVSGLRYKYNFGFHKYREITISIVYVDYNSTSKSIQTLREELYAYFKTNDLVTLEFEKVEGSTSVKEFIQGYVSQHSPTIFSNNEGCTIKVMCSDPWFKKRNSNEYVPIDELQYNSIIGDGSPDPHYIDYTGDLQNGFIIDTRDINRADDPDWQHLSIFDGETLQLSSYKAIWQNNEWVKVGDPLGSIRLQVSLPSDWWEEQGGTRQMKYDGKSYLVIDLLQDELKIYIKYSDDGDVFETLNCIGFLDSTNISDRKNALPKLYAFNQENVGTAIEFNVVGESGSYIASYLQYNILNRGI